MSFASSTWSSAGPVLPIGKNSSGSSSRQAERSRQVIRLGSSHQIWAIGSGDTGSEIPNLLQPAPNGSSRRPHFVGRAGLGIPSERARATFRLLSGAVCRAGPWPYSWRPVTSSASGPGFFGQRSQLLQVEAQAFQSTAEKNPLQVTAALASIQMSGAPGAFPQVSYSREGDFVEARFRALIQSPYRPF